MLVRQPEAGLLAAEHAGVGEQRHPGGLGRGQHREVLRSALPDLVARDQQDLVTGAEGVRQRLGAAVVGDPDLDALGRPLGGLLGCADRDGDLARGDLGQQALDDEAAELAGGGGDDDHLVLLGWMRSASTLTLGAALTIGKYALGGMVLTYR